MIALVSSQQRERAALTELCVRRDWTLCGCDSIRAFRRLLARESPNVVVTRAKLEDGYSDDVIAALQAAKVPARVIVLMNVGTPSGMEARQVSLGADCVLRDPVRTNVLLEYLNKYTTRERSTPSAARPRQISLAGMILSADERLLSRGDRQIPLTPRETALAQLLVDAADEIVRYEDLYRDLLGRSFQGDTSNMRVLLGKLVASATNLGVDLREWIQVIPKTGYRYCSKPVPVS